MTKESWREILKDLGPEFDVRYTKHGWHDRLILVITERGAFTLDPHSGSLLCMCIFAPSKLVDIILEPDNAIEQLNQLLNHRCTPWPG